MSGSKSIAVPPVAVVTKDASLQPPPPKGLKYVHLTGPDTLTEDNAHYPVLTVGKYSFWALSYDDNREGLALLAYDENNVLVRQLDFTGARYIVSITYDPGNRNVVFLGQANHKVIVLLDQLLLVGLTIAVVIQDADHQPSPPEGLKYVHLTGPNTLEEDNAHYPVLTIGEHAYWALSYDDNREGLGLLAYDQNNDLVRQWDLTGARYLVSITYNPGDSNVVFVGQGGHGITVPISELLQVV